MNKKRESGDSFDSLLISKRAELMTVSTAMAGSGDLENADVRTPFCLQPQGDFKRPTNDREPQSRSSGVSESLNGMMTLAGVVVGPLTVG